MDNVKTKQDTVVLIHGFGGKRLWMLPLSMRLRSDYRVINWSYFSLSGSIDFHAARFASFLKSIETDGRVNVVAHSMGSIVTRAALRSGDLDRVNRIVLLAPPNSGSHVARYAGLVAGRICKPIAELSSDDKSYVNRLPKTLKYETGVIAGRYDILVPVSKTGMEGLADHQVVNGTHNSLLFSRCTATMTKQFFETGKFAA